MQLKNLYRLHRRLSIFIGIPMLLWAGSGLMHPLMTNVRPDIKTQASPEQRLAGSLLQKAMPVKQVLQKAGIEKTTGIQVITIDSTPYYQVLLAGNTEHTGPDARYFNLSTGRELKNGDATYAKALAKYFLTGETTAGSPAVLSVREIKDYTDQYSYVNRLLPVWQVVFDRKDQIGIYTDTHLSAFAFATDRKRRDFNRFFGWFHTWSWMDAVPKLKAVIIGFILFLALITAALGIYITGKTKAAKAATNPIVKARKLHRVTAIIGAVFFLSWAFSGLVHAVQNARPPFKIQKIGDPAIYTAALPDNLNDMIYRCTLSGPLSSLALMGINGQLFIRTTPSGAAAATTDLMKTQAVHPGEHRYVKIGRRHSRSPGIKDTSRALMTNLSEKQMAAVLAWAYYAKSGPASMDTVSYDMAYLTRFTAQYNFSDKILPVWQITRKHKDAGPVFIDVSSGSLVKKADRFKQADALIFAFFHKHEFMSWAGKSAKDTSTIIGVLILISVIVIGYRLYFIRRLHQKK